MNQIERTFLASLRTLRGAITLLNPGATAVRPAQSHSAEVGNTDEIPLAHRLAILYLMAPVAVWLVGWFEWWLGIPFVVVVALAFSRALSGAWALSVRLETGGLILVALAWVMMTAAGGVFDVQNFDWDKHRAIFLDLGRGEWPTFIASYFEAPLLLRYYLGFYMAPGLVASWFGPAALNWAVPLWTWGGIALILVLFTRGLRGWKALAAALILIFFSTFALPLDRLGVDWGRVILADLRFSPQHFIAGALYALLLVQLRHHKHFHAVSGVVLAASVFWSPPIAVGLLPMVAVMVVEHRIRPFLSWQNIVLAIPILGLIVAYITSGATSIPQGWLWEEHEWNDIVSGSHFPQLIGIFVFGLLVLCSHPRLQRDAYFVILLVTFPFFFLYSFGLLNEYFRYISLVALVLLSYYSAHTVLAEWRNLHKWYRRGAFLLLSAVLVVGGAFSLTTLAEVVSRENVGAYAYESLREEHSSVLQATPAWTHDQYVTQEVPAWFGALLRSGDTVALDRGELILESAYDVYLNGKELIYVRAPCSREETETRFILFVYPANKGLLEGRKHDNLDFWFSWSGKRVGEVCIATRTLPEYEIDRFKTGQYIGTYVPTGVRWEMEHQMR